MTDKETESYFINLLDSSIRYSALGKMKEAKKTLLDVYSVASQYPFILWDNKDIFKMGKSLYLINHFDFVEDEKSFINIGKFAYLYLYRSFELLEKLPPDDVLAEKKFENLKFQLLLFNNYEDSFIDSICGFYIPKTKKLTERDLLVNAEFTKQLLKHIKYSILEDIKDLFDNFKKEEFLTELFEDLNSQMTENSNIIIKEAVKTRKLLYSFFKYEIEKNELIL